VIGGDEEGGWIYTGRRGESVIDYVQVNEGIEEELTQLVIGDNIDLDHHPLIIRLKEGRSSWWEGNRGEKGMEGCLG